MGTKILRRKTPQFTIFLLILGTIACGQKKEAEFQPEGSFPRECIDAKDNDRDGLVDCEDNDCSKSTACTSKENPHPGHCEDGADNDADGYYDCEDPDCFEEPVCGGGEEHDSGEHEGDSGEVEDELPEGWPDPQDSGGPSLRKFVALHTEYPNLGDVIEGRVAFRDAQNDVEGGGEILLKLNGGNWRNAVATAVIGGADGTSWVEDGKIWFVIANVQNWETYRIDLMATDKQGNRSNEVSTTVNP